MSRFGFINVFLRLILSATIRLSESTLITKINYGAAYLSAIIIFFLVFYNGYATCLRYFFNSPPAGVMEISTFMLPVLVFLGMGFIHEKQKHIVVDLMVVRLKKRQQSLFRIFANLLVFLCGVILVWKGAMLAFEKLYESSSSEIMIPLFPFYIFVPLGSLLISVQAVREIGKELKYWEEREQHENEI